MAAGYTNTPLIKKLGIRPEYRVQLIHAPANYFQLLEQDISSQVVGDGQIPDLVHVFVESAAILSLALNRLRPCCRKNPKIIIWVSWYKKSAGIATDVTEDTIRKHAFNLGLVDIKVCAVSEQWSGLKLVVPLARRS